jgi:polysaccharide pyruvyl transferase WcaK-like protein
LLYGWYGGGNSGDEAVLAGLVQMLHERDAGLAITALSVNPEQTARLHGIRAVRRSPLAAYAAIKACDTFALGGGGTVQDVTSVWNLPSFLLYPLLARRRGKRVVWVGVGVGPLGTRLGRWLAGQAARAAERISVRDEASAALLTKIGAPAARIEVTADPALGLRPVPRDEALKVLREGGIHIDGEDAAPHPTSPQGTHKGFSTRGKDAAPRTPHPALVVFALRRPLDPQLGKRLRPGYLLPVSVRERLGTWSGAAEQLYVQTVAALAGLADYCIEAWNATVLFVPFDPVDSKVAAAVQARMRHAGRSYEAGGAAHPATVMGIIGLAEVVIAMRLHALIFGAAMGRPLLALSYDRKVGSFMRRLGAEDWTLPLTEAAALQAKAGQLWRQRDQVAAQITARAGELKRKAMLNADIIAGATEQAEGGMGLGA